MDLIKIKNILIEGFKDGEPTDELLEVEINSKNKVLMTPFFVVVDFGMKLGLVPNLTINNSFQCAEAVKILLKSGYEVDVMEGYIENDIGEIIYESDIEDADKDLRKLLKSLLYFYKKT